MNRKRNAQKQNAKQRPAKRTVKIRRKKQLHPVLLIFIDLILIGASLCTYAYFHHVKPVVLEPVTASQTPVSTDAPDDTVEPTNVVYADHTNTSDWSEKFAGKFTTGAVLSSDTMYISSNVNVTLIKVEKNDVTYYIEDIYIRDIEFFKTAFAQDAYGRNLSDWVFDMAADHDAVCAINGDFYGIDTNGVVIRNGILYGDEADEDDDICVLYYDGVMKTFAVDEFDEQVEMANGAYQAWCFGPALLDQNGDAIVNFTTGYSVSGLNPRAAIGYYEPGHYCFVAVDGRKEGYSIGMTLPELSAMFKELGCVAAYNMDGGGTAMMMFGDQIANQPYQGGRKTSDIIYIHDGEEE